MAKFRKFSSIGKYSDIVPYLPKSKPEIPYLGFVKLHGTNTQVMVTAEGSLVACSKEHTIAGSDFLDNPDNVTTMYYNWFQDNYLYLAQYAAALKDSCPHLRYPFIISGEFAGGKISGSAAVSHLDYFWAPFSVGNLPTTEDDYTRWFTVEYFEDVPVPSDVRIFPVWNYKQFGIIIEPEFPENAQRGLERYTTQVEKECPFGKAHGVSGLGEGIVWSPFINRDTVWGDGYLPGELPRMSQTWFKTKGHKSAVTKSRNLGAPTPEELADAEAFVEYAVTENRILQGIRETDFTTMRDIGKLMKWVNLDVRKECITELETNGIEWGVVAGFIPAIVKRVAKEYLQTN